MISRLNTITSILGLERLFCQKERNLLEKRPIHIFFRLNPFLDVHLHRDSGQFWTMVVNLWLAFTLSHRLWVSERVSGWHLEFPGGCGASWEVDELPSCSQFETVWPQPKTHSPHTIRTVFSDASTEMDIFCLSLLGDEVVPRNLSGLDWTHCLNVKGCTGYYIPLSRWDSRRRNAKRCIKTQTTKLKKSLLIKIVL